MGEPPTEIRPESPPCSPPSSRASGGDVRRFFVLFVGAFVALEVLLRLPWSDGPLRWLLGVQASAAAACLRAVYADVAAMGVTVVGEAFHVVVSRGCDGSDAAAVLLAGLVAFPASARQRLAGAGLGLGALFLLNIVRVASLYVVGAERPALFQTAHLELWPALFVLAALLLWLAWAVRCSRTAERAG